MKTRLKFLFYFALLGTITSCSSVRIAEPIATEKAQNNDSYEVQYLFEHDGCKIYRFYDNGNYVYFSNCKGDITAIKDDSEKKTVRTITR